MSEPIDYAPIRTRVVRAVETLGSPTTLEVAERAMTPTTEARQHLNDLAKEGTVYRFGRRWALATTEMVEPTTVPVSEDQGFVEDYSTRPAGWEMLAWLVVLVLGTWLCSVLFPGGGR
jgi:hypothetical protein